MGTLITLAILLLVVGLAIRGMIRNKKKGKAFQCGAECSHGGGHCH